jgi:FMN phosphatase YigB (HAD superfamily)
MIDTLLFDLDGTLLQMRQDQFIQEYLRKLARVFAGLELDVDTAVKALWAGTGAMVSNDGSVLNSDRFWQLFASVLGLSDIQREAVEIACDRFYSEEFDSIQSILLNDDLGLPGQLIKLMKARGYSVVLATNPIFPLSAVITRLSWINLKVEDFEFVSHYANSSFCKPNLEYFSEILQTIQKTATSCMMIGNNPREDMCCGDLGMETFLVTDCLENESEVDISAFRHGSLVELSECLARLDLTR